MSKLSKGQCKTQGRALIALLKRRAMTYRDMLAASPSCSPWKRVTESLAEDEAVVTGTNAKGWTTWRVVKATGWTA